MTLRVLNVITGLGQGGAETVLARLMAGLDRARFEPSVVSLSAEGPLAAPIRAAGVPLECLGMTGATHLPSAIARLRTRIHKERPHVVQSWLYHADMVATLATWGLPGTRLAWNLRCSDMEISRYALSSRLVRRACVLLSSRPDLIIGNSQAGLRAHGLLGYRPRQTALVPNGIDPDQFRPDPEARRAMRAAWGCGDNTIVIGMVARWDPQKDHESFVRAAARLNRQHHDVAFVLAGEGLEVGAAGIGDLLRRHEVSAPVHLLGRRSDVAGILSGLDIASLSAAYGEGFPNAVAEAMSCRLPCAVTQVGDCAELVDGSGLVVPPRTPDALAAAWSALIEAGPGERQAMGAMARARIQQHFSLERMIGAYQDLWTTVAVAPATP